MYPFGSLVQHCFWNVSILLHATTIHPFPLLKVIYCLNALKCIYPSGGCSHCFQCLAIVSFAALSIIDLTP